MNNIMSLKIIFKVDYPLSAYLNYLASNMHNLFQSNSIADITKEQLLSIVECRNFIIGKEDQFLQLLLQWSSKNKSN